MLLLASIISHKACTLLNTERSYKKQGHTPLKHFVDFLCNGGKSEYRSRGELAFFFVKPTESYR